MAKAIKTWQQVERVQARVDPNDGHRLTQGESGGISRSTYRGRRKRYLITGEKVAEGSPGAVSYEQMRSARRFDPVTLQKLDAGDEGGVSIDQMKRIRREAKKK